MNFEDSKTITLLRHFTKSELKRLKGFVESGLGGPPGRSLDLLEALAPFHPQFSEKQPSKSEVFEKIFPGQPYKEQQLRYVLSDLYRQAIRFLAHSTLAENESELNPFIRQGLASRGADKPYLSLPDPFDQSEIHEPKPDHHLLLFREQYNHLNHFLSRKNRTDPEALTITAKNLDIFYLSTKLKMLCELINSQNVKSGAFDFFLREEIEDKIQQGEFSETPSIAVYFGILKTLTEPEVESHFEFLQQKLAHYDQRFVRDELRDIYKYLMNYCIKKINLGDQQYLHKLFSIYQTVLKNRSIYNGRFLSQWDFKNIVVVGIRAGQNKWVESFINGHIHDLPTAEQENARTYNLAYLNFSNGDYHAALRMLQNVEFTDIYYQLDMRSVILKCYYEMDDYEALNYHLAAFRLFLSRNKVVSDYQRTIYRNLIRFSGKLMQAKGDKSRVTTVANEIEQVKQIADISWIRKKAEQAIGPR
jgi:hypothetical protein